MEISELDPQIKDTQDELIMHQQKTKSLKSTCKVFSSMSIRRMNLLGGLMQFLMKPLREMKNDK